MTRRQARDRRIDPLAALEALERAANGETLSDAARRAVVERYARKRRNGRVVLCTPTHAERAAGDAHSAGKPVYDTTEDARAAAAELVRLGSRPLEPYDCHRSQHGHVHLRTKRGKAR